MFSCELFGLKIFFYLICKYLKMLNFKNVWTERFVIVKFNIVRVKRLSWNVKLLS